MSMLVQELLDALENVAVLCGSDIRRCVVDLRSAFTRL